MAITQERLKELFYYCPETGIVTRIKSAGPKGPVGSEAGSWHTHGYRVTRVDYERIYLHRLIWIFVHGSIPSGFEIDHINGDKSDNRLVNLRLASRSQNMINKAPDQRNKSGARGVHWSKKDQRWVVQLCSERKRRHIGQFNNLEDAVIAAKSAATEFARAA